MKRLAQGKVTLEDNTMDDYSSILCRDNTLYPIFQYCTRLEVEDIELRYRIHITLNSSEKKYNK